MRVGAVPGGAAEAGLHKIPEERAGGQLPRHSCDPAAQLPGAGRGGPGVRLVNQGATSASERRCCVSKWP